MLEEIATRILPFIVAAGIPAMVVLFYAEGTIVGKVFQAPPIFIGYVSVTSPSTGRLLFLSTLCVLATVAGQWTVYRGFNTESPEILGLQKRIPVLGTFPDALDTRIGEKKMRFIENWFEKGGAVAIIVTNTIPVIRCLIAIPAGLNNYSRKKFLLATTVGNVIYTAILIGTAYGIGILTRLFF